VLEEHWSVKQSVVLAREDERGGKRLVGYVVGEEGMTSAELKRYVRERLPEYMVPEAIVVLEKLPVTANGKIDRKRLPSLSDARPSIEGVFVAPRDALELQLVQIWERLLDVHPISVTDNFFDLGGHSLLAISLMTEIQEVTGQQLPLTALFQGGTIEGLASILRRVASSISWSCLIELQASGTKKPLFFVHPGGGNVLCYFDLARCLGLDRPFYGFQTPGLYGELPLYTRIEDMASYYIEAMKEIQPEGPYFLGGWSLGGIIAYEMAQQLVAQGQGVCQLFILDTGVQFLREEHIEEDDEQIDEATQLIGLLGEALLISMEDLESFEGDERIDYVLKRAMSANLIPPDVDIAMARSFLKVFNVNGRARRNYIPQVYPGIVTLFKTAVQPSMPPSDGTTPGEEVADTTQDPTMGWCKFAAGGVRVIDVPGNHQTMVSMPHVETLALRIRGCLDGA
jgi:thioesterase domain-containing protein